MTLRPRAVVVAGPPGSGKSRLFPVADFGVDAFNVDDRAAALNGESYQTISREVRAQAQRECEAFIEEHITAGRSYAVETTLRTAVAIEQARRARASGFSTLLLFVATNDPQENVRRVALRAHAGGHAAPVAEIVETYARSVANLVQALDVFETIRLWDNSEFGREPTLVARRTRGRWQRLVEPMPTWVPIAVA